ncbi:cobalt ABC transporter ATP-binding protein [Ktedonobacter sp. SOSP1-85]|uniref:ABC transporter ATP-binding protein n=1 Tax=Ktedonobacter sp. SOSP1-85 TaxID=2778367 RepID=UPI0019157997|nr:ATP-binding cassette domain-containing protein [Ktedonobacter sp. SOSP1-85]GHO80663.1 cobalt ABC transporter ATP-binding protein [Ktedonobacter sp. SOSP1-85]
MPDVHVKNVSFTYAGSSHAVLRSVNLTIPEGEFVLLAGPSGCGKSTLALALAGLIPSRIAGSFKGHISLGDKPISTMEVHEAAQHIGIVFQSPEEQLVHLDVESEVAFGPENLALSHDEIKSRVRTALAYTHMEPLRKLEIFALSGGQKQRVAIAATLAMQSHVLVLDEPTSDLDPAGTQEVLNVLRTLNKRYSWTIILIEHKIDEVIPWVDRVLLMDQGKVVVDAPPRQAFAAMELWERPGVAIPQMVHLARQLPDIFPDALPLSVDEAHGALRGTRYALALQREAALFSPEPASLPGPSSASSILSWEQVGLTYGEKTILSDINLTVQPQEWLALVGSNGAGKTSLASLAMGFQAPTLGNVRYEGRPVVPGQISRQSRHMAYLFQAADKMLFTPTVEKELLFGAQNQSKRKSISPASYSVEQLLEIVDLLTYRHTNPFHLSYGQRKRLAIGALLARYPRVLILDEPTTGQDEKHARAFLRFLQQLREQEHLTYLMITHNMQAVAEYATRMVVLHDTRIVMDGPPEQVFAHSAELEQYGVLSPPIAQLHARLCEQQAQRVALNLPTLLQAFQSIEAHP